MKPLWFKGRELYIPPLIRDVWWYYQVGFRGGGAGLRYRLFIYFRQLSSMLEGSNGFPG
jgi:hypothetical protein